MTTWLRLAAGAAGFVTAVLAGAAMLLASRDRARVPARIARLLSRLMCPAVGVRVAVRGAEHLRGDGPRVYVANHQSYLDYPILGAVFPERTVLLGQSVLDRIPVVGWLFRATGNVVVSRESAESRRAALATLLEVVRQGRSVWVFPEGTRNAAPGTLLRFHRGAFHVAATLGVPVVPIVVEPLAPRTDLRARRLERRTVHIDVLPPVHPAGRDALSLADEVRERMEQVL